MAVFTWVPTFPASLARKPTMFSIGFGDGYSQDLPAGINNNPELWTLQFSNITKQEAEAIDDFLLAQNGMSFDWTNNRGDLRSYKCQEWTYDIDKNGVHGIKATFKEYFGT